jgi:truncated hemoglobin YjbI
MEDSLLEKLGGESGVGKIVDEYYKRALEDPRIKNRYNGLNLEELKRREASLMLSLIKKETPVNEGTLLGKDFVVGTPSTSGITKHEFNLLVSIYEEASKDLGATSYTAQQFGEAISSIRPDVETH